MWALDAKPAVPASSPHHLFISLHPIRSCQSRFSLTASVGRCELTGTDFVNAYWGHLRGPYRHLGFHV